MPPAAPPLRQPSAPGEAPSPFLFIDAWVLAGVALLAVTGVAVRFVYTRLRRKREPSEDYWQNWDEPG